MGIRIDAEGIRGDETRRRRSARRVSFFQSETGRDNGAANEAAPLPRHRVTHPSTRRTARIITDPSTRRDSFHVFNAYRITIHDARARNAGAGSTGRIHSAEADDDARDEPDADRLDPEGDSDSDSDAADVDPSGVPHPSSRAPPMMPVARSDLPTFEPSLALARLVVSDARDRSAGRRRRIWSRRSSIRASANSCLLLHSLSASAAVSRARRSASSAASARRSFALAASLARSSWRVNASAFFSARVAAATDAVADDDASRAAAFAASSAFFAAAVAAANLAVSSASRDADAAANVSDASAFFSAARARRSAAVAVALALAASSAAAARAVSAASTASTASAMAVARSDSNRRVCFSRRFASRRSVRRVSPSSARVSSSAVSAASARAASDDARASARSARRSASSTRRDQRRAVSAASVSSFASAVRSRRAASLASRRASSRSGSRTATRDLRRKSSADSVPSRAGTWRPRRTTGWAPGGARKTSRVGVGTGRGSGGREGKTGGRGRPRWGREDSRRGARAARASRRRRDDSRRSRWRRISSSSRATRKAARVSTTAGVPLGKRLGTRIVLAGGSGAARASLGARWRNRSGILTGASRKTKMDEDARAGIRARASERARRIARRRIDAGGREARATSMCVWKTPRRAPTPSRAFGRAREDQPSRARKSA